MWIVITGNPMDGFGYTGPFESADQANEWADMHVTREYDWWLAKVEAPTWAK